MASPWLTMVGAAAEAAAEAAAGVFTGGILCSRRGSLSSGSGLAAQGEGLAGLAHHADDLLDGDLVALLADALEDGTVLLALHVEGGLAGLDGKQIVAGLDGVALLDIPLAQDGAVLGQALLGHADEQHVAGGRSLGGRSRRSRRGSSRSGSRRRGGSGGGIVRLEALAGLTHHAHQRLHGDLVPLLTDALEDGAVLLALHVEGGLAGLDGEHKVALFHGIAFLDIPFAQDGAVLGQALLRHTNQ